MNRIYYSVIVAMFFGAFALAAPLRANAESTYPNGLNGSSDLLYGIFPGDDPGNCCWMSAHGSFKVSVPAGADGLLIDIFIPPFAAPPDGQSLRVQIDNAAPQNRCCFGAGTHEIGVRLPPAALRQPIVRVQLWARSTFVPKDIGLNQDPRHLSVLVRGVAFANAQGQRFDTGPRPWLALRAALPILAALGLLIIVVTLRRPILGAVALIITDPFLLAYDTHGTSVTLPKVALIAVVIGLVPALRRLALERSRTALGLLLFAQLFFVVTMLPAMQHAVFHGAALRETLKAVEYALTLLVAYAAYRLDPDERAIRLSVSILTLGVTILAAAQIFTGAAQSEILAGHIVPRIAGPLEGPNQLAGFLGVVVPVMLAFAVLRPPLLVERWAIALGTLACFATVSRGGTGALLAAAALVVALHYRPQLRAPLMIATGIAFAALFALALGVAAGAVNGRAEALFGAHGSYGLGGGLGSRIDLWHGAYAIWRSHPLFGIGPGNFEFAIAHYDPGVRTHANSMYFQALAEQGIVGFLAMLAVVAASIAVFVRRLNEPLALGAFAAAIAMAFHQIVDCMWLYPKVGVIWWIVLALGAAAVDLRTGAEDLAEPAVA